MPTSDPTPTEVRNARRLRLVVFLFIGIVGGVVGGGFILDESVPDVSDLALPQPTVGEVDPFAWFESDPPVPPGASSFLSLFATAIEPLIDPSQTALDRQEELVGDGLLAERESIRDWFASFEAEFARSGGDPNRLPEATLATRPHEIVLSRVDESRSLAPYSVAQMLLDASHLERAFGDFDQAFAYLSLALRIETWILIYGEDPNSSGLDAVLDRLTTEIEEGHLARVESEKVLEGLATWELPATTFDGASARFFRDRVLELEKDEFWRAGVAGDPPAFRFKKNRTIRRLAEHIREVRKEVQTPGVVGDAETSPLVKAWIDRYGDTILQAELDYLHWLHVESFLDPWHEGQLISIAIAIHRYERAHGEPPTSLDRLVPAFLPQVPEFPGASAPPSFDRESRMLQVPTPSSPLSLELPRFDG